jgi:hypothetical protein
VIILTLSLVASASGQDDALTAAHATIQKIDSTGKRAGRAPQKGQLAVWPLDRLSVPPPEAAREQQSVRTLAPAREPDPKRSRRRSG